MHPHLELPFPEPNVGPMKGRASSPFESLFNNESRYFAETTLGLQQTNFSRQGTEACADQEQQQSRPEYPHALDD